MARIRKVYSGIGGQAVLEGIMMKNKEKVAIAVRRPDGGIEVDKRSYDGVAGGIFRKVPFIRGIFSFMDSLVFGTGCLNYSAAFYADDGEEEEPGALEKFLTKIFGEKAEDAIMAFVTVLSFIIAIGIFMVLPYFLVELLRPHLHNESLLAIIEGALRLTIFLLYVVLISLMKDIRRVYMYHGAEHKCINCVERGFELNVPNVMRSSRMHKRCGTSFLLFVMLVSIVLFFFIRVDSPVLRLVIRIALIPVIAGISYEIIRLAGKTDFFLVQILSAPGLLLQRLTTREPTEDMVEVAIKAVETVFDWKTFLKENFDYEYDFEEEPEQTHVQATTQPQVQTHVDPHAQAQSQPQPQVDITQNATDASGAMDAERIDITQNTVNTAGPTDAVEQVDITLETTNTTVAGLGSEAADLAASIASVDIATSENK